MNQEGNMPVTVPEEFFRVYLLNDRRNRTILWMAVCTIVIQFVIFKYFYPYIHFVSANTFGHLIITQQDLDLSKHAVGYSNFLRLFGLFTSSDTALAAFQYLLIQCGALLFLFTLFYFYRPGKAVQAILLGFMVLNPLCLSLANLISSDGIFLTVSLIWVASLIWVIHRPSVGVIIWQALVLVIALTIRYNAIIYPVIALFAFVLSRLPVYRKLVGIGVNLVLCGAFIVYTGSSYKSLTGPRQYAPVSGWIMASNALYAYRYVDSINRKPVPARFKVLDTTVQSYFNRTRSNDYPMDFIMFAMPPSTPLVIYMDRQFADQPSLGELRRWATVAPLYMDYGSYITWQYPWQYARHLLWRNVSKYFAPSAELLQTYGLGNNAWESIDRKWFGYNGGESITKTKSVRIKGLWYYQAFSGIINMLMLGGILGFTMLRGFTVNGLFRRGLLLAFIIWLLNAGFTFFASYSYLHFQAFPLLLTTTFTVLLGEWLWKVGATEQISSQVQTHKTEDLLANGGVTDRK